MKLPSLVAATVLMLACAACGDPKIVPLMGNWTGGFAPTENSASTKKAGLTGFLQLYATQNSFKMRLENPVQAAEFEGNWKLEGDQILLTFSDMKFENPTEEEQARQSLEIVTPEEMRAAYGRTVALNISQEQQVLRSPLMTIGGIEGIHEFAKGKGTKNSERALDELRKR